VAKVRDRFAAQQPMYDAAIDRWAGWRPTSPEACSSATTGPAMPLGPLPRLDRLAGHRR
jgi:hypothetical protein